MYDIEDLLFQIEEELKNGKKSLFGSGVTIDADVIYSIVDKIRASLPDIVREAKAIVRNSDRRYQEETIRAQGIISQAQQRANEMLANHTIIDQAQKEAAAIRAQAIDYSNRLKSSVHEDVVALLADTEAAIAESLKIVSRAKSNIESSDN
ncbi:MAG: hypothetical protein J6V83_04940 [Clostridia bacterium]|nr:hypothetical protein [Clostridia bacterium]